MRPTRQQMYMAMARAASMRSTCYRLNVGAVIVRERNVVAVGYNGAPSGQSHCTGNGCQYYTSSGCRVVHAEENALQRLGDVDALDRYELYVTHSPCSNCVSLIVQRGIFDAVFFEAAYRDPSPLARLAQAIDVFQILPSGLLVNYQTGALCES